MIKPLSSLIALAAAFVPGAGLAQELGDHAVRTAVPGLVFTRALNRADEGARVDDGVLTLTSAARRDNFRDPDGKLSNNTAPVLLAPVDNTKPWTMTGRLTPEFHATYDAGAFYIWVDDARWLKMAMERDEQGRVRIVTVRTEGTSDDNNHDAVATDDVRLKISSDTKTVGFYYSIDGGQQWQLVRLFRNAYPNQLWVGVSTQSPTGEGSTTRFSDLSLTDQAIRDFRLGQ